MGKLFLACLLLAMTSVAYSAPLYKWVDENGVTHFSERPPEHSANAQTLEVNGVPIISGSDELAQRAEQEQAEANAAAQAQQPLVPEVERVENPVKSPELCEQAQRNIAQIQQNRRVRAPDPETGELRYLSEEEIATQLTNWQKRAETYCE